MVNNRFDGLWLSCGKKYDIFTFENIGIGEIQLSICNSYSEDVILDATIEEVEKLRDNLTKFIENIKECRE